ncbi:deoxyribodipyrimidine photo-lyase [Nocardiopsis sp. Huas11]|uniref:cryptochrome/photolyase family protein n=1 Tax=Nocardiopsis sp. Huas11 TaxID=2183912 RepID=UPI000EAF445F|nr:deoxyribodipyrimidine photo-lyase [Nocardiopsis sp. Huas11]RKS06056.1 deoxyribodipyrimidine photo-lyase [Nocardiopsis sp. Huas11]
MTTAVIVLFTQDLRIHDHPALGAALALGWPVLPLFVLEDRLLDRAARNRNAYLAEALTDLRWSLRSRGTDLVLRRGDPAEEVLRVAREGGADTVHLSAGVSRHAGRRVRRLREAGLAVREFPGLTVVPPGEVVPQGGDHYKVFTPYWRAWESATWRAVEKAPSAIPAHGWPAPGELPRSLGDRGRGEAAADRITGGEDAARARLRSWVERGQADYPDRRDDLAGAATSFLSADLRFGCLSPLEVALAGRGRPGHDEFVRQLAWRDFHHQVTAAFPDINRRDYRDRGRGWRHDPDAVAAWRRGRTGVPIVDAGMRQLLREGFMHNRTRMITAAFLTRTLRVHWIEGAEHFEDHLVDGDVADNHGNWQWVAGTGNDTRPNRAFNPLRQARRFDPGGDYVRRYVPELADLPGTRAHTPWREENPPPGYPPPIADPGH